MTRDEAIQQLEALTHAGGLKIITSEHDCGAGVHPTIPPFDPAVCAGYEFPLVDLRHFVLHDVTSMVQAPGSAGEKGQYRAYSDDGDHTQGQPEALLARLTEANKV